MDIVSQCILKLYVCLKRPKITEKEARDGPLE